jgi:predicted transcriptional regulator
MNMVAEIKKAILREMAVKGWGYVERTDRLSDEAIRAIAELVVEGLLIEGDEQHQRFAVFITRKGLDAAEALHA